MGIARKRGNAGAVFGDGRMGRLASLLSAGLIILHATGQSRLGK
jgi:hypothetical protein